MEPDEIITVVLYCFMTAAASAITLRVASIRTKMLVRRALAELEEQWQQRNSEANAELIRLKEHNKALESFIESLGKD